MPRDEDAPKSVLDGVPVVNQAFKSFPDYTASTPEGLLPDGLVVVSSCPKCGSPIYGPRSIPPHVTEIGHNYLKAVGPVPQTIRTCGCVYMPKNYADQMHTK